MTTYTAISTTQRKSGEQKRETENIEINNSFRYIGFLFHRYFHLVLLLLLPSSCMRLHEHWLISRSFLALPLCIYYCVVDVFVITSFDTKLSFITIFRHLSLFMLKLLEKNNKQTERNAVGAS